jgi:hypothetical protein
VIVAGLRLAAEANEVAKATRHPDYGVVPWLQGRKAAIKRSSGSRPRGIVSDGFRGPFARGHLLGLQASLRRLSRAGGISASERGHQLVEAEVLHREAELHRLHAEGPANRRLAPLHFFSATQSARMVALLISGPMGAPTNATRSSGGSTITAKPSRRCRAKNLELRRPIDQDRSSSPNAADPA